MKKTLIIIKYELIKVLRQPIVIMFAFIFPAVWMIINGEIYNNEPVEIFGNVGTIDFLFPALVFMVILVNGLTNIPLNLSKNIEEKIIRRYSNTPLGKANYLFGLVISNIIIVLTASIIMFVIGNFKYNLFNSPRIILFLLAVVLISIGIAFLGIIFASITKTFQSTLGLSFLVYFPLLFLTGASVPLPVMPQGFQELAKYNPFAYMVSFLQHIFLSQKIPAQEAIIVGFTTAILIFFGILLFRWEKRK